ncbi:uncharacterized protein CXorf66 homolog [Hippopotamus amphibius kiboko]|uniref:uncharacterized protein CXorf66 homolog n=1 Tax=Hippopotamus amphibius kiboko TaxID=575201 RepID=UPI0025992944|nr:uncharacterized protein CXorf66 homolog [Hippopotamus amphibius kiboko]
MNLLIYVLLLSIWTNCCSNTNESNESSTTGAKHQEPKETKMDNIKKQLLIAVIGVTIITFASSCFCFLYYSCISDDATKTRTVKKEGVTAMSSRSSKISFTDSKTVSLCNLEKQSTLASIDKLSGFSSPEKASTPSSAEKLIRPSSREKSRKPSSSKRVFRPPHQEKSHRTRSLEKARKRAHAHKLLSQGSPSYPSKAIRPPRLASLEYPVMPTKTPCPPYPQNQSLPKPSSSQKLAKRHTHCNLKRSVSTAKEDVLPRPQPVKSSRRYKEKCLVCRAASELFAESISEAKKKSAQNLPFPRELKVFSKSFHKMNSRYSACCGNANDSDMTTHCSDSESDREIIFICNIKREEIIYKTIQNN